MMDKTAYEEARRRSSGLFNNSLVLPVARAVLNTAGNGRAFKLTEVGEELGGRAPINSIRTALQRIEACGAVEQLVSLGAPYPDLWERKPHPFWDFVTGWLGQVAPGELREPAE